MATERDFEQLDDYLSNKLSAEEKALFEQKLDADPELSNEMSVQQELIKGIQKARVKELKAMLNNVPVSPMPNPGSTSVLVKIVAGTAVFGVVATGIWFLGDDKKEQTVTKPQTTVPTEVKDSSTETVIATKDETTEKARIENNSKNDLKQNKPVQQEKQVQETADRVIDVYDPTAEDSEGTENHVSQAESQPLEETKAKPSMAVAIDKTSKEYSFHYQYKDDKLFLYGPFESNLYDIMEFFSNNKRTVFLHYKAEYYLLKEVDNKIRPLTAITDPALISKLEESRKLN